MALLTKTRVLPELNFFPANPYPGQTFIHNITGRRIEYEYDGANWNAKHSYGTITVYVDQTDGTDDLNHGYGPDAAAFKTIQYAIDSIPRDRDNWARIYINDEVYNEDITIIGKTMPDEYPFSCISLHGTLTVMDTGTCAVGSVQGNGAVQGTVEDDTGGWGVNAYQNKLVYFNTGVNVGVYRMIDSNDADTLTICGTWPNGAPAAGDTFTIYDWGTTINSVFIGRAQVSVDLWDLNFVSGPTVMIHVWCRLTAYRSSFPAVGSSWSIDVDNGKVWFDTCYITHSAVGINIINNGLAYLDRSKVYMPGDNDIGIALRTGGLCAVSCGTVLDCGSVVGTTGIYVTHQTAVYTSAVAADGFVRIRNWAVGIAASRGGQVYGTANIQYQGNTLDEQAIGASFGYID